MSKEETDELSSLPVALDDNVRTNSILDEGLALPHELGGEENDRGGSVADFRILSPRNIDKRLGGGVYDFEQLEDGGAVVGDGGYAVVGDDELVHAARAERGRNGAGNGEAGGDVGQ